MFDINFMIKAISIIFSTGILVHIVKYALMSKLEKILTPDRTRFQLEIFVMIYVITMIWVYLAVGESALDPLNVRILLVAALAITALEIIGAIVVPLILFNRKNYAVVLNNGLYFIIKAIDKDQVLLRNCRTRDYRKVATSSINDIDYKTIYRNRYYVNENGQRVDKFNLLENTDIERPVQIQ